MRRTEGQSREQTGDQTAAQTEKPAAARTGIPALYFTCFVGLGVYFAYGNVFLRSRGVPVSEIGVLTSIYFASALLSPPVFGYLYDEMPGKCHLILAGCAIGASAFEALIPAQQSSVARALLLLAFSLCASALQPLLDAEGLWISRETGRSFQSLRTWGSAGYLLSAVAGGILLTVLPLSWSYYGLSVCFVVFALLVVFFRRGGLLPVHDSSGPVSHERRVNLADARAAILSRPFLVLLGLSFVYRIVLTGPMAFLSVYLTGLGLGTQLVGVAYALTGVSEVAVLYVRDRLFSGTRPESLIVAAIVLAAFRWSITAFTRNVPLLLAVQCLHGANFMLFYITAVRQVSESVDPHLSGIGQTVYGSVFYGLGPVVGTSIAGLAVSTLGYTTYFAACAAGSIVIAGSYLTYLSVTARKRQKMSQPA